MKKTNILAHQETSRHIPDRHKQKGGLFCTQLFFVILKNNSIQFPNGKQIIMKYFKASFISKAAVVFSMFRNAFMFRPLLKHSIRYQSLSTTANIFSSAASVVVEDFGENFMVPLREHKLPLEDLNSHPLDQRIVFIENDHKYIVDGQPMKYSVTGLLPEYFDKFNSSSVAEKMMSKNNWPGEGYKHPNEQPYTLEEILKKWNDNGLDARNRGTWMHFNIESYLNGMDSTASFPPEFEQFLQFHRAHIVDRQIQPFRTEWNVFSKKIDIAGSVDFVGKLPDNTYEIIDWKRSKDLESNLVSNYNKKAK